MEFVGRAMKSLRKKEYFWGRFEDYSIYFPTFASSSTYCWGIGVVSRWGRFWGAGVLEHFKEFGPLADEVEGFKNLEDECVDLVGFDAKVGVGDEVGVPEEEVDIFWGPPAITANAEKSTDLTRTCAERLFK